MTNKPNDVRISRELLEDLLAQPADQQHERVYQVRTHGSCCWGDIGGESLEECRSQPEEYEIRALYRHAQPTSVKVDERAEFEGAVIAMGLTLHNPATGKYWQDIHCGWMMWQARAKLNGESKVVMPERLGDDPWAEGWNACLDEVAKLNGGQS